MTKNLAYVIGVFLGDGSITQKRTFELQVIDKDFAEETYRCLKTLSDNKVSFVECNRKTIANNNVYRVSLSDAKFCKALIDITNNRENLPIDFDKWEKFNQLELIAGLLDSEGYVSISKKHEYNGFEVFDMKIGIGATNIWLYELYKFLKENGIKVGEINREILKSKKIFAKFIFNKKSFIENNLYFKINRKQERIEKYKLLFPGSTTIRCIPKTKETKKIISNRLSNRIFSLDTKEKMSVSAKNRVLKNIRDKNGRFLCLG